MIIEPRVKDYICTTAHPVGCAESVRRQVEYTKSKAKLNGHKKVLVIGASTGYGLASRIALAYRYDAATLGVAFEREAKGKRTATAGWYNTKAFEEEAKKDGLYAKSINGDAFSKEIKDQVIATIKEDLGKVDMVIYSLAAPRRTTSDGTTYVSALKTTNGVFTNKSLDLRNNTIISASVTEANEEEINSTVKVMGGEDWYDWIEVLRAADVITEDAVTMAYSYIGPELTYPVYNNGTIGMAKKDLQNTAIKINEVSNSSIKAYISVNKALVTQSSSAIPVVPLYICMLYKIMKEEGVHENCIEQMNRLFGDKLPSGKVDSEGRIRLDEYEMRQDIQDRIMEEWSKVTTDNVREYADIEGYWEDFYNMFGFKYDNVDYEADVEA